MVRFKWFIGCMLLFAVSLVVALLLAFTRPSQARMAERREPAVIGKPCAGFVQQAVCRIRTTC